MKFREWLTKPYDLTNTNLQHMHQYFNDVRDQFEDLEQIVADSFDDYAIATLEEMLGARWNDYEMVEEENATLHNYFKDFFTENLVNYSQLLQNYRKEYDYATGNKRIVTRNDNINIQGQRDIASKDNNKHTDYELPNKVTDDNYESTPSAIGKDASESESSNTYNNETSHSSSVETEYKNEFLDLKNKYLNQIRDVIREFANKFELCFQLVYDWRN